MAEEAEAVTVVDRRADHAVHYIIRERHLSDRAEAAAQLGQRLLGATEGQQDVADVVVRLGVVRLDLQYPLTGGNCLIISFNSLISRP